jgi:hypothetical protein
MERVERTEIVYTQLSWHSQVLAEVSFDKQILPGALIYASIVIGGDVCDAAYLNDKVVISRAHEVKFSDFSDRNYIHHTFSKQDNFGQYSEDALKLLKTSKNL